LRIPEQTLAAEQSGKKMARRQKAAAPPLCYDYKSAYPQTVIELRPGKEEIGLLVPTAALRPAEHDFSGFSSGGKAIILNYDVLGLNNRYSGGSGRFISANAELGSIWMTGSCGPGKCIRPRMANRSVSICLLTDSGRCRLQNDCSGWSDQYRQFGIRWRHHRHAMDARIGVAEQR